VAEKSRRSPGCTSMVVSTQSWSPVSWISCVSRSLVVGWALGVAWLAADGFFAASPGRVAEGKVFAGEIAMMVVMRIAAMKAGGWRVIYFRRGRNLQRALDISHTSWRAIPVEFARIGTVTDGWGGRKSCSVRDFWRGLRRSANREIHPAEPAGWKRVGVPRVRLSHPRKAIAKKAVRCENGWRG